VIESVALFRPPRISILLALLALASLAGAGSAAAASSGTYPAKLTVAGELTVTMTRDYTGPCERAQGYTIEAKASVNVSGKIDLGWIRRGGLVQSVGTRDPGGATNRNVMSGYHETQRCDEAIPFEESDKPQCSSHTGTGIANVGGSKNKIFVGIARQGGGEQDASCQGGLVNGPKPVGTQIGTLQSDVDEISLPLGVGVGPFAKLAVGQKLTRRIKLSGPCQLGTVAKASVFRDDVCTVKGSFDVTVKRLAGKGRGGFTTARAW
jgi:hypothetical protein